jgi:hypothetical protein
VQPPERSGIYHLEDSGPVVAQRDGQVIEGLRIDAHGTDGITIAGLRDVTVRNVEIFHSGGRGILVENASYVTIDNVRIVHSGAPPEGDSPSIEANNVECRGSFRFNLRNARLLQGSSGVYLSECDDATLEHVEGYDFRGPFPRGQFVQFNRSDNPALHDFFAFNPPGNTSTEDTVSVFKSDSAHVSDGLVDGSYDETGVGIMFEKSADGYVRRVDAMHQSRRCFSNHPAYDVVWTNTRCRQTLCDASSTRVTGWAAANRSWEGIDEDDVADGYPFHSDAIEILDAVYYDVCTTGEPIVWDQGLEEFGRRYIDTVELSQLDFQPRVFAPIDFAWRPGLRDGDHPPIAVLVAPVGARAWSGDPIALESMVEDPDGDLERVDFYVGGRNVATTASARASIHWRPPGAGMYRISVLATDARGHQTMSPAMTLDLQ